MQRHAKNPIIQAKQFEALSGFEVFGIFNPGVVKLEKETVLLIRVAQRPIQISSDFVETVWFNTQSRQIESLRFDKRDSNYNFSDPRTILNADKSKIIALTSVSSLYLAKSRDGVSFELDEEPFIFPDNEWEAWGCEDARITKIEDTYWINYTAVSDRGITTALASTKDFVQIIKHGVIFPAANRDVVIFPEKINGKYAALHRPMPYKIGDQAMWWADSPDMFYWGSHKFVAGPRSGMWDGKKIGGGAPPIRTEKGWISIYHGVDKNNKYSLGAMLFDAKEPWKVVARSRAPILEPTEIYEKNGVFSDVCFTCGTVVEEDEIKIYYGAVDSSICLATTSIKEILRELSQ